MGVVLVLLKMSMSAVHCKGISECRPVVVTLFIGMHCTDWNWILTNYDDSFNQVQICTYWFHIYSMVLCNFHWYNIQLIIGLSAFICLCSDCRPHSPSPFSFICCSRYSQYSLPSRHWWHHSEVFMCTFGLFVFLGPDTSPSLSNPLCLLTLKYYNFFLMLANTISWYSVFFKNLFVGFLALHITCRICPLLLFWMLLCLTYFLYGPAFRSIIGNDLYQWLATL